MMPRRVLTGIGLVIALIVLGYWYSARRAAVRLVDAINVGDTSSIDAMFDWPELTPALASDVAASFPDPRAQTLAPLLRGTFKSIVLRSWGVPPQSPLRIGSAVFTNFDEYAVTLSSGNRWVLRRHGLRWLVDAFLPTLANARRLGLAAVGLTDPQGRVHIVGGDIYFGDARYGCRLTTTADVTDVTYAADVIAYVRTRNSQPSEEGVDPHTQIWFLNLRALDPELAVDGKQPGDPKASTQYQRDLVFSLDGRFLYFSAAAWATSDAIVELDMKTHKTRFLSDGNGLAVILGGKYRGDLLTQQHKYRDAGGSYEETVILSRDGTVLANLTDEDIPWDKAVEIANGAE